MRATKPKWHIFADFKVLIVMAICAAAFITGCSSDEKTPDVSNINVGLKTYRFDLELYAIDTNHIAAGLQSLLSKYPDFLPYYLDTLREYGIHNNFNDTVRGIREDVRLDLTFRDFRNLEDSIKKYYPDNKQLDEELTAGFKYIKHYFPDAIVPRIMYLNLGLSKWATFPVDNGTMCIALDMFLGDQFPFYKAVGLPDYMLAHRRKEYIPVSLFSSFYRSSHPFKPDDHTLLDLMLQRGREQYFLHKVLPHHPDSVIFAFTGRQTEWCKANEALIYNYFINRNLLYNKDPHSIMPYVTDGPFAKGLEAPDDPVKYTPGNIGTWLGYSIVCNYMARYPNTTLKDLVNGHYDAARFLDSAKYKPK